MQILKSLSYYIHFGGSYFLLLFFIFLILFYAINIYVWSVQYLVHKNKHARAAILIYIRSSLALTGIFIGLALLSGIILTSVAHSTTPARATMLAEKLLGWDKKIFGVNLPLWIHTSANPFHNILEIIGPTSLVCYSFLALALGLLFIAAFVRGQKFSLAVLLAFVFSEILSTPLWLSFPGLTPAARFLYNITNTPLSPALAAESASMYISPAVTQFISTIKTLQTHDATPFLDVTNFPSMHIAWATLILFFGYRIWKYSAIILVPFFLLTVVATLYGLQHYGVDILAGATIGAISCFVAVKISKKIPDNFIFSPAKIVTRTLN